MGMGGMGSFILFSQSYFVINLGRKKKKKKKKRNISCSAEKYFGLKNKTMQAVLVLYHVCRDPWLLFRRVPKGIGTERGLVCMC